MLKVYVWMLQKMVKWLYENYTKEVLSIIKTNNKIVYDSIRSGNLDIVKWIYVLNPKISFNHETV